MVAVVVGSHHSNHYCPMNTVGCQLSGNCLVARICKHARHLCFTRLPRYTLAGCRLRTGSARPGLGRRGLAWRGGRPTQRVARRELPNVQRSLRGGTLRSGRPAGSASLVNSGVQGQRSPGRVTVASKLPPAVESTLI